MWILIWRDIFRFLVGSAIKSKQIWKQRKEIKIRGLEVILRIRRLLRSFHGAHCGSAPRAFIYKYVCSVQNTIRTIFGLLLIYFRLLWRTILKKNLKYNAVLGIKTANIFIVLYTLTDMFNMKIIYDIFK